MLQWNTNAHFTNLKYLKLNLFLLVIQLKNHQDIKDSNFFFSL